ncbi:MAG: hypothetical protein R3E12_11090 [Candidatus Eisenbacteria bacterium]
MKPRARQAVLAAQLFVDGTQAVAGELDVAHRRLFIDLFGAEVGLRELPELLVVRAVPVDIAFSKMAGLEVTPVSADCSMKRTSSPCSTITRLSWSSRRRFPSWSS